MRFEWDEAKSRRCLESRGFDFIFAARVFKDESRITIKDKRHDYDENRYVTYGNINSRLFCIAFAIRNGAIRIISARKAIEREIRAYGHVSL